MTNSRSKVALVRYSEPSESPYRFSDKGLQVLRDRLLELLDHLDWDPTRIRNKSVLLKPNLVRPQPDTVPAVTTDPRVILALIDIFRDWGAAEVAVGEKPGWGLPSRAGFKQAKLEPWIKEHGGVIVPFDEEEAVKIENPRAVVFRHVLLPITARRYQVIVNLPKLKTHMHTTVSLGIKNLYGFVTDEQRLQNHRNDLYQKLVDFLYVLKPDLTIIDGIWALEGQAPLYGITVPDMGVLIGSEDIVAVDAVGSAMMGIDPGEVATTRLAHQAGFGTINLMDVDFEGVAIADVRRNFQRAVLGSAGTYENIEVLENTACVGCQSALRHSLDRLAREERFKSSVETVVLGRNFSDEQLASVVERHSARVFCFGDCTEELYYKLSDIGNIVWVPGCAPHIFDYYLAYLDKPIEGERPHSIK